MWIFVFVIILTIQIWFESRLNTYENERNQVRYNLRRDSYLNFCRTKFKGKFVDSFKEVQEYHQTKRSWTSINYYMDEGEESINKRLRKARERRDYDPNNRTKAAFQVSYINEEPRITDASKYKNKILLENYSYIHGPLRRVGPNCDRGYVHDPKFLIKNPVNFQIPDNERKYLCEPPGKGTELAEGASNLQKIREYIAMSKESRNVTLFCSVYTHSEAVNHTNAIKETWGNKCDGLLFASDISDLKTGHMHLPSKSKFGFTYHGMVQRTRTILAYLYDNFLDDYDYFHISGDDAFLIVENLKEFLASEKVKDWDKVSDQYMIAGFWMHWGAMKEGYFYLGGGSGYTLSKKAWKAFVEGPLQTCNVKYNSSEQDVWFTKCARILTKNNFIYTRDASGAHRYHQMPVQLHATYPKIKFDNYEKDYIAYLVNESLHYLRSNFMNLLVYMGDYISKSSIAFHKNY